MSVPQDVDRVESGKAAFLAAAVGGAANLPYTAYLAGTVESAVASIAGIAISCALFGVVYRYARRDDALDSHLKVCIGANAHFNTLAHHHCQQTHNYCPARVPDHSTGMSSLGEKYQQNATNLQGIRQRSRFASARIAKGARANIITQASHLCWLGGSCGGTLLYFLQALLSHILKTRYQLYCPLSRVVRWQPLVSSGASQWQTACSQLPASGVLQCCHSVLQPWRQSLAPPRWQRGRACWSLDSQPQHWK